MNNRQNYQSRNSNNGYNRNNYNKNDMNENAVSVRRQGGNDQGMMPVAKFIELVVNEVREQLS